MAECSGPGPGVAQSRHAYIRRFLPDGLLLRSGPSSRGRSSVSRAGSFFPCESSLPFAVSPPPFVGRAPPLRGPSPLSSWATAPLSSWSTAPLLSWATAPYSRGQRPPSLVGNGPLLSRAWPPPLRAVLRRPTSSPFLVGRVPSGSSRAEPILVVGRSPPCARLSSVSLATAGGPQDRRGA